MLKDYLSISKFTGEANDAVNCVRSGIPAAVFGVTFAEKCHLACSFGLPVLYIVKDSVYAQEVVSELSAMAGEDVVYLPAKDDVLLYKTSFDKTSLYNRLSALYKISCGARYVVATPESLLQLFPKNISGRTIRVGDTFDVYEMVEYLVKVGYRREEFADSKATFAMRGDVFEIYPVNDDKAYRVDLFGDEVETIKQFDADDRDEKRNVKEFSVVAATDIIIDDDVKEDIKERLKQSVLKFKTLAVKDDARLIAKEISEKLDENAVDDSFQFVMPILPSVTDDFISFMPDDTVVVYDECKMIEGVMSAVVKEHTERCLNLSKNGKAFDFTINQLTDSGKLVARLAKKRNVALQNITTAINFFNPLKTFSIKCSPVARYSVKPETLFTDVSNWKYGGYSVIICCGNSARADKMVENLSENGISSTLSDTAESVPKTVVVTSYFLPTGLIYHSAKIVIVGTADVYLEGNREKRIKKRRGDLFQAPEAGDFAVHEVHGVGYVRGVQRITTQEGSKDYVAVEYLGGDVLYVGVDDMDKLTKYVGGDKPTLNKIGGKEFDRIKERVRASISQMTINLKKLYAARAEKKGFAFSPDTELSAEFDEAFEFEPTEDQLQSIAEIKADMESQKVMDRLLCGDVGFGKTEVAFRAVFKAVLDGKQAALVCPTTILCEQHFRAAEKRFKDFGIRIASINRFKSETEQTKTIAALKNGEIDFIIGTHRLFGKDVGFKDLGLLILDEEQRFGVEHKEKLKLLKENVDTLTMTATPIPRTLHMSLSGIRDISTINTPPKVRIPVQTYVTEESDAVIADAARRELARGGQVLIMYNRVETIYSFADGIRQLLPEAKIVVAHGRMDKKTLEDSVMNFYDEKYNVLIATTIIENGIDLPKANTLIVIDSDRLGLSTLYQLKGRVGRSNVMAHAYFTFKKEKVMTDTAYRRLSALMEFTEMGSGYKIAMRDLEIRGAGSIMGREQHGHMERIGYELYNKLLKENLGETVKDFDTELDVKMDAYIPENYIGNSSSRMDCYKQIAELRTDADKKRIVSSLEENYGKIPKEVENLILIAELKVAARKHGAVKISLSSKKAEITLNGLDSLKEEGFLGAIDKAKDFVTLSFSENPTLVFKTEGRSADEEAVKVKDFLNF
ncbi:MAG: transcription-repair coupling factor [Clostridia bacterium]|nr:transcription-repair coupling factor [Clostridia bacterium]